MNKIIKMTRLRRLKSLKSLSSCNPLFLRGCRQRILLKNSLKPSKRLQQTIYKRKARCLKGTKPSSRKRRTSACAYQCINPGPPSQFMDLRGLKEEIGPTNLEVHFGFTPQLKNQTKSLQNHWRRNIGNITSLQEKICQNFLTDM